MSYFLILFMGIKTKKNNTMYIKGYFYKSEIKRLLIVSKKKFCQKRGEAAVRTAPLWCGLKCVSGSPVVTYIASIAQP